MKIINVRIEGTTPLLQHRFEESNEVDKGKGTRKIHIKEEDPRTLAERCAHRLPNGQMFFPGAAISRLLRESGGSHKQRGSRRTLKYIVPAAVLVNDDTIPLVIDNEPIKDFEIDSRPVTIPATKGRIMRHRPRINKWGAVFSLSIDDDLIEADTIHQLLSEGGNRIGIGDFRPEKGGPFGRFIVTEWKNET